jgi:hypothetical protein
LSPSTAGMVWYQQQVFIYPYFAEKTVFKINNNGVTLMQNQCNTKINEILFNKVSVNDYSSSILFVDLRQLKV